MSASILRSVVAGIFLIIGVPTALLGLAFVFNVRGVGVRYVGWYRENRAWTQGIAALHTPRATRVVAGALGLLWFIWDGAIVAIVVPKLLN